MLFAIFTADRADAGDLRAANQVAHRAYLEKLNAEGSIAFSGPFLDNEGKPDGSLVVVDADNIEAAKALLDGDPFSRCGLFERSEVRRWRWGMNAPEQFSGR